MPRRLTDAEFDALLTEVEERAEPDAEWHAQLDALEPMITLTRAEWAERLNSHNAGPRTEDDRPFRLTRRRKQAQDDLS